MRNKVAFYFKNVWFYIILRKINAVSETSEYIILDIFFIF